MSLLVDYTSFFSCRPIRVVKHQWVSESFRVDDTVVFARDFIFLLYKICRAKEANEL